MLNHQAAATRNLAEIEFYAQFLSPELAGTEISRQAPDHSSKSTEELLSGLDYHGISLLAWHNNTLDAETLEALGHRRQMMAANEAQKMAALLELFEAFDKAGLNKIILFKGSALAYSTYPEPWLRPRTDNDCLIAFEDLAMFTEVFEQQGYQKLFAIEGQHVSYQSTFGKRLAGASTINFDLHWRVNNRQMLANSFTLDELLSNGISLDRLSTKITSPSTVDSLLVASLHRLGHHNKEERLAWLYDMHLLASSLNEQQWDELTAKAKDKQLSAISLEALQLCQHLFKTNTPAKHLQQLKLSASQSEPSQIFLNRDLPEWRYFIEELRAMPTLSSRFGLVFENIWPSSAYVRQQMQTSSTIAAYAKRFWRGLKRVAKVR